MKKSFSLLIIAFSIVGCSSINTLEYEPGKFTDSYKILEAKREAYKRRELERIEAEKREAERIEAEKREAEKREAERVEAEKKEAERMELERIEAEKREAERIEAEKREAERIKKKKMEALERARLRNMSYEEKIKYNLDNAKLQIDEMVGIANSAREEEIQNKNSIEEIEKELGIDADNMN